MRCAIKRIVKPGDTTMLIKMTLAAVLVLGAAASAALAGDNSGEYSGGFVIPGNMDGVNPIYHPELAPNSAKARKAYGLVPSIKLSPRTWQKPQAPTPVISNDNEGYPHPK
jgi:hypothetical protein